MLLQLQGVFTKAEKAIIGTAAPVPAIAGECCSQYFGINIKRVKVLLDTEASSKYRIRLIFAPFLLSLPVHEYFAGWPFSMRANT